MEMKRGFRKLTGAGVIVLAGGFACTTFGQPVGRTLTIDTYAEVSDPMTLSFSGDGVLYVGRDLSGSGGGAGAAASIHRVLAGGVVEEFGPAIYDPDAVLFDAAGVIAPQPNSVLVGGIDMPTLSGAIKAIAPDGTASAVLGPSAAFFNPSDMVLTDSGQLLFADFNRNDVKATDGGTPASLMDVASPGYLAYDAASDRVYVDSASGRIDVYDGSGAMVTPQLAVTGRRGGLALGPGDGRFGGDLYAVSAAGDLLRIDAAGTVRIVGGGLSQVVDLAFGPDGDLYLSEFDQDRILRVSPSGFVLGDMDGNGTVDAFDVDDFELALADRAAYDAMYPAIDADVVGNIDGAGLLDAFDVEPFEQLLASVGASPQAVPSPSAGMVLVMGGMVSLARRKKRPVRHRAVSVDSGARMKEVSS